MINWGKTIKKYREKLHLTQVELASRVSVTSTYISAVEHSRKEPSFGLIESISRAFGLPQEILYWDALTFPTRVSKLNKPQIKAAKNLVNAVYNQLTPLR